MEQSGLCKKSGLCEDGCIGCFYWRELYDDLFACHYMLHTGERRPCEAGKKCTVRK